MKKSASNPDSAAREIRRLAYLGLALFFGLLGLHNFYAGETERGLVKLVLLLLAGWLAWITLTPLALAVLAATAWGALVEGFSGPRRDRPEPGPEDVAAAAARQSMLLWALAITALAGALCWVAMLAG